MLCLPAEEGDLAAVFTRTVQAIVVNHLLAVDKELTTVIRLRIERIGTA